MHKVIEKLYQEFTERIYNNEDTKSAFISTIADNFTSVHCRSVISKKDAAVALNLKALEKYNRNLVVDEMRHPIKSDGLVLIKEKMSLEEKEYYYKEFEAEAFMYRWRK